MRILSFLSRTKYPRQKGSMSIEAIMAIPMLLTFLAGSVEVGRFINLHQKLNRAATTLADLTSRAPSMTQAQITDIFFATASIVEPYDMATEGVAIISSVSKTPGNVPKVIWQKRGGGALAATSKIGSVNGNAALPSGFTLADNESVIVTEVIYHFKPMFVDSSLVTKDLYERAMFRPRLSTSVTLN